MYIKEKNSSFPRPEKNIDLTNFIRVHKYILTETSEGIEATILQLREALYSIPSAPAYITNYRLYAFQQKMIQEPL